jgi:NTP pyrophosphatase (non-canonical NTP hydrolase)
MTRDLRQATIVEWGTRCFGEEHMRDQIVRAARFIEEAAELVQAVGLSKEHAIRALDHVYSREPGKAWQEAGGVGVTLMALCNTLNLSAEDCEIREVERVMSKDPQHFALRNQEKIEKVDQA